MGKLTFKSGFGTNDGKTLTKPFTYNGKTYNKITLKSGFGTNDGKVISLVTAQSTIEVIKYNQYVAITGDADTLTIKDFSGSITSWSPLIIQFNENVNIGYRADSTGYQRPLSQIQLYDNHFTNLHTYSLGTPIQSYSFQAGNAYKFEDGKAPVLVGAFEKDAPTIFAREYRDIDGDTMGMNVNINKGQSFNFTSPTWVQLLPSTAKPTTQKEFILQFSRDVQIVNKTPFPSKTITINEYFGSNFVKGIKVNILTGVDFGKTLSFTGGHAYKFSPGKDPVDMGKF